MSFTFNTSNNIGKVRALIGDTTEASALLTDEEVTVFIDLRSNSLFEAASLALRSMAARKAIVAKLRKAGDYTEDSRSISKALLDLATTYDQLAQDDPAFADVEIIYNDFNYNHIVRNKALRGELPDD